MRRFKDGQRVLVRHVGHDLELEMRPPRLGTVRRLRRGDDGAWVELDERASDYAHPFPAEDTRGRHVLTFPEACDEERTGRKP